MTNSPTPEDFSHIATWVFDLDNTLYPHHSNLFSQIDVLMTGYVSELLTLPRDEARKLQKELYLEHGTTLAGLMARYGINSDDFLQKVHDIDYSWLAPDDALGEAIKSLPGRKFILTNGSRGHAERTARQLGILDHFDDIFDIVAAGLTPKPARETYDKFLALHEVAGSNAVMFEDLARKSHRAESARHENRARRTAQFRADLLGNLGARRGAGGRCRLCHRRPDGIPAGDPADDGLSESLQAGGSSL
jgi:putative hydrolase of the HAD superfamily